MAAAKTVAEQKFYKLFLRERIEVICHLNTKWLKGTDFPGSSLQREASWWGNGNGSENHRQF